jgi:hypothetical protein
MPRSMHRFKEVLARAGKQDGLVTRAQLGTLGFQARAILRAVNSCRLVRVFHDVFRLAGTEASPRQLHRAVLLWAGPGAALSHLSAAWLWGLDGHDVPPAQVSVSILRSRVLVVPPEVRLYRVEHLAPGADYGARQGLSCTGLARTVFDLARVLTEQELELAYDSAVRRGPAHGPAIAKLVSTHCTLGRLGAATLSRIVRREDLGPTRSALELGVRRALRAADIALPIPQLSVSDRKTGKQIGVFDFAWPEHSVIVLANGYRPHSQRQVFEKDHVQWAALAANGWTIVPITWRRLESDREGFLDDLRRALTTGPAITS